MQIVGFSNEAIWRSLVTLVDDNGANAWLVVAPPIDSKRWCDQSFCVKIAFVRLKYSSDFVGMLEYARSIDQDIELRVEAGFSLGGCNQEIPGVIAGSLVEGQYAVGCLYTMLKFICLKPIHRIVFNGDGFMTGNRWVGERRDSLSRRPSEIKRQFRRQNRRLRRIKPPHRDWAE